ncbi:hypothetical protein PIB30_053535, partial [Stylosanthes scabra]|nr:hypothetical protein [Stylosanthes scabra]
METDSLEAVELINKARIEDVWFSPIVKDIVGHLRRPWEVLINHVNRLANSGADFLAKKGLKGSEDLEFINSPPSEMRDLLRDDFVGVVMPHE